MLKKRYNIKSPLRGSFFTHTNPRLVPFGTTPWAIIEIVPLEQKIDFRDAFQISG